MQAATKIKVGIIGAGKMGSLHLEKFLSLNECEVAGVYDLDPNRSKSLSEKVKVFKNLDELMFESDAVVIASSSNTHFQIVKLALHSDLHVLVEKPLALNSKEAHELARLAEVKNLVLQVGFVERFRLKELMKSVKLSQIEQIECERITEKVGREPELDVVTDLMIHDLDLILSLNLGKVRNIRAKGTSVLHETLDIAVVDLEFDSGVNVHLLANRLGPNASRKMRMMMNGRYCKLDLSKSQVTEVKKQGSKSFELGAAKDFLLEQAKNFCGAVIKQNASLVPAHQGIKSIELVEEILSVLHARPNESLSSRLLPKEN